MALESLLSRVHYKWSGFPSLSQFVLAWRTKLFLRRRFLLRSPSFCFMVWSCWKISGWINVLAYRLHLCGGVPVIPSIVLMGSDFMTAVKILIAWFWTWSSTWRCALVVGSDSFWSCILAYESQGLATLTVMSPIAKINESCSYCFV